MKSKDFNFLQHQLIPIEHLVSKCKKQHGLIVNHYMGSGKTLVGLGLFKNYPNDRKVIICPKGFDSIWLNEAKKFNINPKDITIIFFNDLINFELYKDIIENSIVIVDEAHNLYKLINIYTSEYIDKKMQDNNKNKVTIDIRLINFIDMFYKTKKILLLSGTLTTSGMGISDIRWLINIASGKKNAIVPYDINKFENKYLRTNIPDKVYLKVIKPLVETNPFGIFSKDIINTFKKSLDSDNLFDFILSVTATNISGNIMRFIKKQEVKHEDIEKQEEIVIDKNKPIENYFNKIYVNILHKLNPKNIALAIFIFIIAKGIQLILKYLREVYNTKYNYNKLDIKKLQADNIGAYFSYFNYKNTNDPNYPTIIEYSRKVKYTTKQLALLIKMLNVSENLSSTELTELELFKSEIEAELYREYFSIRGKFMSNGIIIGNLYEEPNKFKEIVNIYIKDPVSTVVYSNLYESGLLLFAKYLRSKGIKYKIYDHSLSIKQKNKLLLDFKNKRINMLLLHPDYYEGISIHGSRYLHILEPINNTGKKEQLLARCVRYKSHDHLNTKDRIVKIYQWSCTLIHDIDKITHGKTYIKEWNRSIRSNKVITDLLKMFSDIFSPDDLILKITNRDKNFKEEFNKSIKHISIENFKLDPTCCIWTPNNIPCDKNLKSCI